MGNVEQLDRRKRKRTDKPKLTIIRAGSAFFNRAAVEKIPELKARKRYIDLFFDRDRRRIGFLFRDKPTDKSYKLGEDKYETFTKVSMSNFCKHFDDPPGTVPRPSAWLIDVEPSDEGIYFAKHLKKAKITPRPRRKNGNGRSTKPHKGNGKN